MVSGIELFAESQTRFRLVSTVLAAAMLAAMALGATSCGSGSAAEAYSSPPPAPATTVDSTRVSDPKTGFTLNNDFTRVFFVATSNPPVLNIGRTDLVYQGKLVQARAFMSATVLYQPPLPAIDDERYIGGDDSSPDSSDLVAVRCQPTDPSQLRAVIAIWLNIFEAATSDLANLMGYTPADCPTSDLDPSYPVDQRVYCKAQDFSDEPNKMIPLTLQATMDTGATIFKYVGTAFKADTKRTTGWGVLSDVYEIGWGFSGLGFSVKDSYLASKGGNVSLTAAQALEQSVVTEYVVMNVPLQSGGCRCVRVKPYTNRDENLLDWDAVWKAGQLDPSDGHCVERTSLP